jgi:protein-tyrosine phosphatase
MQPQFERHVAVAGTFNIRDLGGYASREGQTRWRRLLRADGLHRLDAVGMAMLADEGVRTVIDLRRDHELESHPNPFRDNPAVAYHNVSLFEALDPTAMTGGDVLLDLYLAALATRHGPIAQVLTLIADAPEGIVLFHCTAGKDRTGLIAALILALAGVETAVIVEDYALTGPMIAPLLETFIADAIARGSDVEAFRPLLACDPQTMAATLAFLIDNHGSVEAYLASIGLDNDTVGRLKARLAEEV